MDNDETLYYAVVDKNGDILCIVNGSLVSLPLDKVTIDTVFSFWNNSLDDFKKFIEGIRSFLKLERGKDINIADDIDLDECSFIDLTMDEKSKTFSLG